MTKSRAQTELETEELEARIQALEDLVRDFEAYLMEIAPYTYRDGARAKSLRERTAQLLETRNDA